MKKTNIQSYLGKHLLLLVCACFCYTLHAQEVTVYVSPVQTVLPPQAGLYVDNPGKFFTIRLVNNTDEQQLLHLGMHIDQLFPEEQVMVITPDNQLPRQPIVLAPRQNKALNPIEMKDLFRHFNLADVYIRDGLYNDYKRGIFGLLPEGQYVMSMQAYRWNPELTSPVQLNLPENGRCVFNVCYSAQAPRFLTPQAQQADNDPLAMLRVAKLDKNVLHQFTWTQPTLNCNATMVSFSYDVKVVRLDGQTPDDAIEHNPVVFTRSRLAGTTLSIPDVYLAQMKRDTAAVYAMQVTANSSLGGQQNALNYTLIENEGKSDILLFRFYDPTIIPPLPEPDDDDLVSGSGNGAVDSLSNDSLYIFEQPQLTHPQFSKLNGRKVFVGDSIMVEWRKAWFRGGQGMRQDTIQFNYHVRLYRGNSADEPRAIFLSKPVYEHTVTELTDTIRWEKIKDKVYVGDYILLRVTAEATNETSIRMLGDSLNYKDFAIAEHFDEEYMCGINTANVENKQPIASAPKAGSMLRIGSWSLELNGDVKQDKESKALSGTGFIHWGPGSMRLRVAVKFDDLMVNTDSVVYDGQCNTYPKDKSKDKNFSAQEAVDSLFSSWGLDDIYGNLGLPDGVAEKIQNGGGSIAEKYKLGEYYTYFKNAEKQWDKVKEGNLLDLYFPTEMPDKIADLLPEDMSLQIASISFSPSAALMNVIGEFVLPKSDVLNNEMLIFGAPRLCIQPDRILPEDGTLCLLSNFGIKDPSSGYSMTFKAPSDPMHPTNGCFLSWENDEFSGLGVQIAMTIPELKRVVDGKATDELPILDIRATIEDNWGDWIGRISMDPFEVEDLPGWTFSPGETIVFDHSYGSNDPEMPDISSLPRTYDPSKAGSQVKLDWNAWQGVYIKDISVQFPKWAVFGKGEEGFKIAAQNMLFDPSGATLDIATYNLMEAKTGSAGGWEFDLDQVKVMITQNNFDSCHIEGKFAVPLFAKKDGTDKGKIRYECDIRHLSEGTTTYYTYNKDGTREEHKKETYGEKTRLAYLFRVQQIDTLQMDCFVADLSLAKDQTYFVLAAEDQLDGETVTHVELNMAGDITIANADSKNKKIADLASKLDMGLTLPGIHLAKMRLANFSREQQNDRDNMIYKYARQLTKDRQNAEAEWEKGHANRKVLFENEELQLTEKCYLDMGEWSLASAQKKLGPFSFGIQKFDFGYKNSVLSLGITGTVGLCEDKINVGGGIEISSKLTIPKDITNLSEYSLSDGQVDFRSLMLDLDFSMLHMKGQLDVSPKSSGEEGFKGALDIDIKELFGLKVNGGYFKHQGDKKGDDPYSWGYFTLDIGSNAGIRLDPIVINRIAGGFFFNARPTYDRNAKKFGEPQGCKGIIGISLGVGLSTTAGEETLNGDLDLNVVYDKNANNGKGGLSDFLFQGKVHAVGDLIDANMQLLYHNDNSDRYLALDITAEAGINGGKMNQAMKELEATLTTFKGGLDDKVKNFTPDLKGGLDKLSSNYDNKADNQSEEAKNSINKSAATKVDSKQQKMELMSVSIPFQMKVTWKEKGKALTPTRWHLYLGEPDPEHRVKITLIDYKSETGIVNVKINANAYLCIGNELPGNGKLPPIDPNITTFIDGKKSGVDTGADMQKAQRSRNQAVKALLPTGDNVNGGVMVGAGAYGYIDVNLGLFYGNMTTIAGFDMALVNYANNAYCTNLNREMGHNGWYATGQFYAYLAANFGLYIRLGKLYEGPVPLINAGIGGVFEAGLPNPSWIDGKARVKVTLLGGLVDIDKKFEFTCGDKCVPFKGNALDGFNLFDDFTLGSDSIAYGWGKACEVKTSEVGKAMVSTYASLGSQYRLVDPTTKADQSNRTGIDEDLLDLQSSRCYIFDIDRTKNTSVSYGVEGARLFEIDATTPQGLDRLNTIKNWFDKNGSSFETSVIMRDASLDSQVQSYSQDDLKLANFLISMKKPVFLGYGNGSSTPVTEKNITVRETKGNKYHLSTSLTANRYYVLVMTGTAYEVENGQKVWCSYVRKNARGKMETVRMKWQQTKCYFFSTQASEKLPAVIADLQPYVAAAFPASADGKLFNTEKDNEEVYECDLIRPTIALNQDIRSSSFRSGTLNWVLRSKVKNSESFYRTQTIANEYKVYGSTYVNMQPKSDFTIPAPSGIEKHNLQLTYTYKVPAPCYRNTNADKWMVMSDYIKQHENWAEFSDLVYNYWDIFGLDLDNVTSSRDLSLAIGYGDMYLGDNPQRKSQWQTYFTLYKAQNASCQKDTTIVLADLWFQHPELKTWQVATAAYANAHYATKLKYADQVAVDLLPYAKPFVGVRPQNEPVFTYNGKYQATLNFDVTEGWYQLSGAQDYRLQDPFLYFAYLSQMVFIGGATLNAYGFDDVAVPHASETLTLTYNGESVQGMGIAQTERLKTLRDRMFGVWNKWYYTNGVQEPEYPLPSGSGELYELTQANQDGKTGAYMSYYKKQNTAYPFHLGMAELIKDFAAPYYIAQSLSQKMHDIAQDLYSLYKNYTSTYPTRIKQWNQLHRGQYLTVSSRGYEVRVPYYQFALIFGDCFGRGPNNESTPKDPVRNNAAVADRNTSFYYSVSEQSRKKMAYRWHSYTSNLMFCRLKSGYPFVTNAANQYTTYGNDKYVEWDRFRADEAMKQVTAFPTKLYRTQSFDLRKGLYGAWDETGAPTSTTQYINANSGIRTFNPFEDRASGLYKKTLYEWIQLVGSPTVTVNSTRMK